MMELMSQVALEVGADRRREVVLETMRDARGDDGRMGLVAEGAVVAIRQHVSDEMPATNRQMQPSTDCL